MRGPGIEPGSTAWKAAMLTITPATLFDKIVTASVAQWIEHQTSNLGVAGSSPA